MLMRDGDGTKQVRSYMYMTALGVLLCFVVCMTLLAPFFLPSVSLINMYIIMCMHAILPLHMYHCVC